MTHAQHAEQLEQAEGRLDERLEGLADVACNLEAPMDERPDGPPWDIRTEYDLMAWGFRVAELRHRAAIAAEMAKAIERQAASEERRLIYAVGGRAVPDGDRSRTDYGLVQDYVRAHLPRNKKSLKTPAGTFAFREAPSVLLVPADREAPLFDWCRKNAPHWIKTVPATESLDIAAIKAHVEDTGEVPADANGEQLVIYLRAGRHDTFSFKPAAGAEALPAGSAQPARLTETAET